MLLKCNCCNTYDTHLRKNSSTEIGEFSDYFAKVIFLSRFDRNDVKARSVLCRDNNLDFHLSLRLRHSAAFADVHETKSRKVSTTRRITG